MAWVRRTRVGCCWVPAGDAGMAEGARAGENGGEGREVTRAWSWTRAGGRVGRRLGRQGAPQVGWCWVGRPWRREATGQVHPATERESWWGARKTGGSETPPPFGKLRAGSTQDWDGDAGMVTMVMTMG